MISHVVRVIAVAGVVLSAAKVSWAWDYEGHRAVNQLALASLPPEFPAFVKKADNAERIAFLAGEPDRWRNMPDLPLKHYNGMDHYLDFEQLAWAGIEAKDLSSFRYDFAVQFATGRAAHPERFAPIDPAKNADHSRQWPGFVPWAITEYYGKLRSAFSYLKTFEEAGTAEEVANAQANIIYLMALTGHYVGDVAQPLHTTEHHNGWVGKNPKGYTTWPGLHSWIDGGFFAKAGLNVPELAKRAEPAMLLSVAPRNDGRDPMFVHVLDYFLAQHAKVEPLYELEQRGKFKLDDPAAAAEGRAFLEKQLLIGGQMLASIWVTAWKNAIPDTYLRAALWKRQAAANAASGGSGARVQP